MWSTLRSPAGAIGAVFLALVAVFGLWASWVGWSDHFTMAKADDWRIWDQYYAKGVWDWLFANQNGHRLPTTLLLYHLDAAWLSGRMALPVLASIACAWLQVATLGVFVVRDRECERPVAIAAFAAAAFLVFWVAIWCGFLWSLLLHNMQTATWCVAALVCLVLAVRDRAAGGSGIALALAALVAAELATWSFGVGIAIWGALALVALLARLPWTWVGVFVACAVGNLQLFKLGLASDPLNAAVAYWQISEGVSSSLRDRPGQLLEFTVTQVGAIAGWAAHGLGLVSEPAVRSVSRAVGALAVPAALAYGAVQLARPRKVTPRDLLALGLMAFAVAASFMVSLGRAWLGMHHAYHPRFLVWSGLFWIGAVQALPVLGRRFAKPVRAAALVGLPVLCLLMLPSLRLVFERHHRAQGSVTTSRVMLRLGIEDDEQALKLAISDVDEVYRAAAHMRETGRNVFADALAEPLGTLLAERYPESAPGACDGRMRRPRPVVVRRGSAAMVHGWAATADGERPERVLVTDGDGRVRGLGLFTPDARWGAHSDDVVRTGGRANTWRGYIADYQPGPHYSAWALLPDGTVCRILTR